MGSIDIASCKQCIEGKEELNKEIEISKDLLDIKDPQKRRIIKRAKNLFEDKISNQARFIQGKNIRQLIEEINPMANAIQIPDNIINSKPEYTFEEPMIQFNNGDIYQGRWNTNCQRDGFGININSEGEIFLGLWNKDQIGQYGAYFDNEGNYYKGNLVNGKGNGQGEMYLFNQFKYVGNFVDDMPNGQGTIENFLDGSKYEGDIINGKKEGRGKLWFKDGTYYEGEFKDDCFNGRGILRYYNGRVYDGQFLYNKMNGKGKYMWEDGKVYEGDFADDKKNGFGKLMWNNNKYYEGQWINNKQHGEGKYFLNGNVLKGQFRFGKIMTKND